MAGSILAVASVFSAYQGYKQGQRQKKAQKEQLALQRQQNEEAKKRRKEAADRADIAMNKARKKTANVSVLSKKEEQASLVGSGGTLLTGVQGVDSSQLNLGGNTLLGN